MSIDNSWLSIQSRLTTLLTSLFARRQVGLNERSGLKFSIKLVGACYLSLVWRLKKLVWEGESLSQSVRLPVD